MKRDIRLVVGLPIPAGPAAKGPEIDERVSASPRPLPRPRPLVEDVPWKLVSTKEVVVLKYFVPLERHRFFE